MGIHGQDGLQALDTGKERGIGLDHFQDPELAARPQTFRNLAQILGGLLGQKLNGGRVQAEQVLEGIVDDLDQAQNNGDLDQEGEEALEAAVTLLFIEGLLFLQDQAAVAEMPLLDIVQGRPDPGHDQGVFLGHKREGEHEQAGDQGEENDGQSIVFDCLEAKVHQVTQGGAQ